MTSPGGRGPTIDLAGVFIPTATPFDGASGDLDPMALRHNLDRWLATDVRGVVIAGTTGEAVLLDSKERRRAVEIARECCSSGQWVLCGTGSESTRDTVRRTREVAEAGADAVLVQPPAFYRGLMDARALVEHFQAVADNAPVPVVLYRVPSSCSSIELEAGLVAELSGHPNIVGIKDSSGSLDALGAYVTGSSDGFQVLVGSGSKLYAALELGTVGGILGVANLVPVEAAAIHAAFVNGRMVEAGRLQERIVPLHEQVVARRGVPGMKAALDLLGYRGGRPRPPLRPVDEGEVGEIRDVLSVAGFLDTPSEPE